jgi:putative ABC transport system substrate-binding protein
LVARRPRAAEGDAGDWLLNVGSPGMGAANVVAFRQGLSETGFVEGKNVAVEYRWAEGRYDRLPALAADLVGRKVDVIATNSTPSALAAKSATSTIPIVFAVADPVAIGLVASLARPRGNLTGFSIMVTELMPKRLELLFELVPQAKVVALLVNSNSPIVESIIGEVREAARATGVQLYILKAGTESEIDTAFASFVQLKTDVLIVGAEPFFSSRRDQLVALASRHTIPATYEYREYVAAGGLMRYGPSITAANRGIGSYAGKILKGANPGDLPVQQPSKFELVIKTPSLSSKSNRSVSILGSVEASTKPKNTPIEGIRRSISGVSTPEAMRMRNFRVFTPS